MMISCVKCEWFKGLLESRLTAFRCDCRLALAEMDKQRRPYIAAVHTSASESRHRWPHEDLRTDAGPLTEEELDAHNLEFHETRRALAASVTAANARQHRKVEPWARVAAVAIAALMLAGYLWW